MLEANKKKWFEKIFTYYNRNLIKRKFHSLKVHNFENLNKIKPGFPLITIANHSSWWDGLILFELFSHFDLETFVLMEEKQLKNLPLFRKLGAFSIVRENPREALKSINYGAEKLKENSKANLWIFPQGEILPNEIRPLSFYGGLAKIIEKTGDCCVVPIGLRFVFLDEFKPEVFCKIGELLYFNNVSKTESKALTKKFQKTTENLLEEITKDIVSKDFQFYKDLI